MRTKSRSVLLLDNTFTAHRVITVERALRLIGKGKARALVEREETVRSERSQVPAPAVILLNRRCPVPRKDIPTPTRRAIMVRDKHTCVYCGKIGNTIDHVHPRSRGGKHEWQNVAAACTKCNSQKGDKTLKEMGWPELHPVIPKVGFWALLAANTSDPLWDEYLQ